MNDEPKWIRIWKDCISLCSKHNVSMFAIIRPHQYMDRSSVKRRAAVLRELGVRGWSFTRIHRLCPMTHRGLRKATGKRSEVKVQGRDGRRRKLTLISPSDYSERCSSARRTAQRRGESPSKRHPLYATWKGILERCYAQFHPSYPWYGAKGIRVCSRWFDFSKFAKDVGTRPSGMWLIRADARRHYTPENCQWSARKGRPHKTKA